MVSNAQICDHIARKLGIVLFADYGEFEHSFRNHNAVTTPTCGVFNMTPMTVTPLRGLFLASATANVMIAAEANNVADIRSIVDSLAAEHNGETEIMYDTSGGTYQITFSYSTAYVGVERTAPNNTGKMIPVHLSIYFSIIENGISSNDVQMMIDGQDVFFTELTVSQQRITDGYAIASGMATTTVLQKIRSFDFVVPLLSSTIGKVFKEAVFGADENKAHLLSITVGGEEYAYMVAFGNTAGSVRAPQNVGGNISLTECDPNTVTFSEGWTVSRDVQGQNTIGIDSGDKVYIFWGDGSSEIADGSGGAYNVSHTYEDSESSYTVCRYTVQISARSVGVPSRSYVFYADSLNNKASLYDSDYIAGTGGFWRRRAHIDWGDGHDETYDTMTTSLVDLPGGVWHVYDTPGDYTITVTEIDEPVWVNVEGA